ncbi:MAG TPA: hypothetical protein VFV39_02990 [Limnobacter sp.]|nr:hypothetical protein [Limnobacter sp.]
MAIEKIRFINVTSGRKVRYWSIGNEPDHTDYASPQVVAEYVKNFSMALRDVDPSIKIYAPNTASMDVAYMSQLIGGEFDITGKDAKGRYYIDGVTFHSYPNGSSEYSRATAVGSAARVGNQMTRLIGLISAANTKHGRTGVNAITWGLGEYNITFANYGANTPADQGANSFLNGQFHADVIARAAANGADFAASWSMSESGGDRTRYDLGFVDGPSSAVVKRFRSSFYHMQMFGQNFSGNFVDGSTNNATVRIFGSVTKDQAAVMVLNMTKTDLDFALRLDDTMPSNGTLRAKVNFSLPVELSSSIKAEATALLVFNSTGKLIKRVDYDVGMASAYAAPVTTTY